MGRPKKTKVAKEKKEEVKINCTCCGKEKKVNGTYFYKSYSVIYMCAYDGRMII